MPHAMACRREGLNMFFSRLRGLKAHFAALERSQAIIEFAMDGTVLHANWNFLNTFGYTLDEIKGRHHRTFVKETEAGGPVYEQFWEGLRHGIHQAGEFQRIGKDGKQVWIQASYNPILSPIGTPLKVVEFATDITAEKLRAMDYAGQLDAINKSQTMVHLTMDGTILDANEVYLNLVGYDLETLRGKNHSFLVPEETRASDEYQAFWAALKRGEFQSGEFKRIGVDGREVWLQASYNPIFDTDGKPFKIVKLATDVTSRITNRQRRGEIQKSIFTGLGEIENAITSANTQAAGAATASLQTSSNVDAVASGAEELVAFIGEISQQVAEASKISIDAVSQGLRTNEIVAGLLAAANRIGEVVDLINAIAAQTNLLALNATIEAARAGESGRGFAVVAGEVKMLASQTGKATDDISSQIKQVQAATRDAVDAIVDMTNTIDAINEISSRIAGAVEQQDTVTRGISANMQTASLGVKTISSNMSEIAAATALASEATRRVKQASAKLHR